MARGEKKNKLFSFRIDGKLLEDFALFCEENCMDVSKRIRRYMKRDVDNWKRLKIARYNEAQAKLKNKKNKDTNDADDLIEGF